MSWAERVSLERRVAAGVLLAVVCAAAVSGWLVFRLSDPRRELALRVEATADGLERALRQEGAAQPLLDTAVASGGLGGAILYDANGRVLAQARDVRVKASEVICRSVAIPGAGRTLCVEPPRLEGGRARKAAIAAAASGAVSGLLAAFLLRAMSRRSLRNVRQAVERAGGDPTYSRRLEPMAGELAPLAAAINDLLARIQSREVELLRRTHELENANRDLEAFAFTVSHDLRGPLGSVLGFADALQASYGGELTPDGKEYVHWILESAKQMQSLIDGLLSLTRLSRAELRRGPVDLSAIARGIADSLTNSTPERQVEFRIEDRVIADGDEQLLRAVLENLIANAWKFTGKRSRATIEFGIASSLGPATYFVRDDGAGFDPTQASKMFRPFQRLHSAGEFEGTGIGLATVQRILQRHGGKAWAEGEPDQGATIYFTTGSSKEGEACT